MIPPDTRSTKDIQTLLSATSFLDFFRKMQKKSVDIEQQTHLKCCMALKYCHFLKGRLVIKYNDHPDKAYVVLNGNILVFRPKVLFFSNQYQDDRRNRYREGGNEIFSHSHEIQNVQQ
jgi:hypothetical protein